MKRILCLVIALLLLAPPALACYGAEALGQGGAFTSHADGVLAVYWNQAGLAFTEGTGEASITTSTPKDYINYNSFMGAAVKIGDKIGIGYGSTKTAWWAGGETWSTIGVGLKLSENFAIGGAARSIEGTDPETGETYTSRGIDLSAQGRFEVADGVKLNAGLLIQDVGGPSMTNYYYQNIRPAISLETDKVTLGFDVYNAEELKYALKGEQNYLDHQVGIEYRPAGKEGALALRGGIYQSVVTYGAGVKMETLFIDFVAIPEWEAVQFTTGVRF